MLPSAQMIESFVDLTYRGLPLGRRVKLAQVRPTSAYLEMPAPMPVGTAIAITTDEGLVIDALVKAIHEQTGGSDKPPGMTIAPTLGKEAIASWWSARVALPEADPVVAPAPRPVKPKVIAEKTIEIPTEPTVQDDEVMAAAAAMAAIPQPVGPSRSRPVTIQPRQTQPRIAVRAPEPVPPDDATVVAAPIRISEEHSVPEIVDDGKKTIVMDAIDPAMLEQLMNPRPSGEIPQDSRTVVMDAVDAMALGLETSSASSSVDMAASDDDSAANDDPDKSKSTKPGGSVQRRRRQPKKR